MRRVTVALLAAGGILVAVAVAYALFGFILASSDVAAYTSDSTVVADLDFDAALANAEAAGYEVERPDSSGFHPEGIDALDRELGSDYEAFRVVFYYGPGFGAEPNDGATAGRMEAVLYTDEGKAEVEFFREDPRGPFSAADLPPDDWMTERLVLLFEVDDARAREYVADVQASVEDDERLVPGVTVTEPVDFHAVYDEFAGRADEVTTTESDGQGWHERRYHADGERFGGLDLVLARAEITHEDGGHTYVVNLDRGGGVALTVLADGGEEIPETEYRAVFHEMFDEMGLPPQAVERLTFEYDPSVW